MDKKIEYYREYVDLFYKPSDKELLVSFYFEPDRGISDLEAAGRIAAESSTGTWSTLAKLPKREKKLRAKAYSIKDNIVKVAYPIELWELQNIPQLLSGIAGNIYGMKAVKNLRLLDVRFPKKYVKAHKGPKYGIKAIRRYFKEKKRPLLGAVAKPKIGFSAKEHAEVGYETWMGGFDVVKDDENLSSLSFNNFYERVRYLAKFRDKAEKETGLVKDCFLNITAPYKEMEKRAKYVADYGFRYCMVDVVVTGASAVQEIKNTCDDLGLAIHAHRAMHAALDRNKKHGMSMYFIAKLMRLIGVQNIHTGTVVGKLEGDKKEILHMADMLRENKVKEKGFYFEQDWYSLKNVFPCSSGGLHPGLVPDVMKIYGNDMFLLISGGIHGHPKGTRAGAKAVMQALDAYYEGISLKEKAKTAKELKDALQKWGFLKPE